VPPAIGSAAAARNQVAGTHNARGGTTATANAIGASGEIAEHAPPAPRRRAAADA
jgi:hypothetical protein